MQLLLDLLRQLVFIVDAVQSTRSTATPTSVADIPAALSGTAACPSADATATAGAAVQVVVVRRAATDGEPPGQSSARRFTWRGRRI